MDAQASENRPAGEFGELVEVTEVQLDVLVTNKQGEVVLGLGPEDFAVEEEGKPVALTGVSFYSNRFQVEGDAQAAKLRHPATEEVLADRYFVFIFHDLRRLGSEASRLVQQQMQAALRR